MTVRAREALDRRPAIAIITDPDVVARHLEDAAHFPGGHAQAVARPSTEGEIAALLSGSPTVLPIGAQSSLTGGATPHERPRCRRNAIDASVRVLRSKRRSRYSYAVKTPER